MPRLHIGHHFFGSGNLGDDLMLAGFLREAAGRYGDDLAVTCAVPFDLASQRLRFPIVTWLPYEPATRDEAIAQCDAWVGLGGSPFQLDSSRWFIDHLLEERRTCVAHRKPMYYLGVGLNDPRDARHAETRELVREAARVWTRDPASADLLWPFNRRTDDGNDLSHAYLSDLSFGPIEAGTTGFVLNFENPSHVAAGALRAIIGSAPRPRWLAQEVRDLPGSERAMHDALPADVRAVARLRLPDYARASLPAMLATWGTPETLVTSRYHATIVAAWAGWNVVSVERAAKVGEIAMALGTATVPDLTDAARVVDAVRSAHPASRATLHVLAGDARRCCAELFDAVDAG